MVTISDRPGGLAELVRLISSIGANIKDIIQERAWVVHDVFSVDVRNALFNLSSLRFNYF